MKKILLISLMMIGCKPAEQKPPSEFNFNSWNQPAWDSELVVQITKELPRLEKAKDIEEWCPTYKTKNKVDVWAKMFVAIAFYESSYDPRSRYHESNGVDSLGLFQLSVPDELPWCKHKTEEDLFEPLNNIRCTVPLFAGLVARDGIVTAGEKTANAKGSARYWATMRGGTYPGHVVGSIKKIVQEFCK